MDQLKTKREQFRISLTQQIKSEKFQENRVQRLQLQIEEKKKKELNLQIQVGIQQIIEDLKNIKEEAIIFYYENEEQCVSIINKSKLLASLMIQVDNVDLGLLCGELVNLMFFYRITAKFKEELNHIFYQMLRFMELCISKNMLFCNEYCKSNAYKELLNQLYNSNLTNSLNILRHIAFIQQYQTHFVQINYYAKVLSTITEEILQNNVDIDFIDEIRQYLLEILILSYQSKDQTYIQFMHEFGKHYIILIVNEKYDALGRDDHLSQFFYFIKNNLKFIDNKLIELIAQFSFNPYLQFKNQESAFAIGIIGVMMGGNSEISNFYFNKFSDNIFSLDKKLIKNLQQQSSEIRRMSAFTLSNIFGEDNLKECDYYSNKTVEEFLSFIANESQIDVLIEMLECIKNLTINANNERLNYLIKQNIIQLIIFHKTEQLYHNQILALLYLYIQYEDRRYILSLYYQEGIFSYIQSISNDIEDENVLADLCKLNQVLFQDN